MISKIKCYVCDGRGRIDVVEAYNPFYKTRNIICPLCDGKEVLMVKYIADTWWYQKRKGSNER